jgi:hypothetical protein
MIQQQQQQQQNIKGMGMPSSKQFSNSSFISHPLHVDHLQVGIKKNRKS